jgi:PPM family protein phosphatase
VSQVAARSSTGGRATNQDRVVAMPDLVVLADGMGGHEGGELAAHAAVAAATGALVPPVNVRAVETAFMDAEVAVQQVRHREPRLAHAGCTLTIVSLAVSAGGGLVRSLVAHAGDSPAFLLRDGEMSLLTAPHTVTAELVRSGRLTEDKSRTHPGQHTLTRSIGTAGKLTPEVRELELQSGDRVLVASDGISAGPDRREVRRLATSPQPVQDVVAELVDYLAATSSDNVTVALLDPWADPDGLSVTHDG